MTTAPVLEYPANEAGRLEAIRRYAILDTPPDGEFDRVTRLASRILRAPIAIISIVDHDRIWFKSHHGLDTEQIDREPGLCASAILQDEPWVIGDARRDPRTLANPLVAGEFGLQFYAGSPLRTADGYNLGTVCVIDREPREFAADDQALLQDLAAIVVQQLELRLAARQTEAAVQERLRLIEERERQAMELNDDVVQRLALAHLALQAGETERAEQYVGKVLEASKHLLTGMGGSAENLRRGSIARR